MSQNNNNNNKQLLYFRDYRGVVGETSGKSNAQNTTIGIVGTRRTRIISTGRRYFFVFF